MAPFKNFFQKKPPILTSIIIEICYFTVRFPKLLKNTQALSNADESTINYDHNYGIN